MIVVTPSSLQPESESSNQGILMSPNYSCNTCKASFESNALQRAHMHTEYHQYNLKRKIASLPPISSKVYEEDVPRSAAPAVKQTTNDVLESSECPGGTASVRQAYDASMEKDFVPSNCLFCNLDSSALEENVQHMDKAHGMFIPDQGSLEDAEGLLRYLFTLIAQFHECLYCGKIKETPSSIRNHMIDSGHCIITFLEELEQFYDYGCEGNEDGDDPTSTEGRNKEASEPLLNPQPDSPHSLYLPSGRTLGHRSLSRYYRQNLHSYPTPAERAARRAITTSTLDEASPLPLQVTTRTRSEMGVIGISEFQKRALRSVEKKALKQEVRVKNQFEARVEKEANRQKHFRPDGPARRNG